MNRPTRMSRSSRVCLMTSCARHESSGPPWAVDAHQEEPCAGRRVRDRRNEGNRRQIDANVEPEGKNRRARGLGHASFAMVVRLMDNATNTKPVRAAAAPPTMTKKSCHVSGAYVATNAIGPRHGRLRRTSPAPSSSPPASLEQFRSRCRARPNRSRAPVRDRPATRGPRTCLNLASLVLEDGAWIVVKRRTT